MEDKNFVRLKIISDELTPEEIEKIVGIKCDNCWRIGDFRSKTIIKETNNGCILKSGIDESKDLQLQIHSLLIRLSPHLEKIKLLSEYSGNVIEFSCAIYSKERPELYFEKETISKISKMGACLDIDFYLI